MRTLGVITNNQHDVFQRNVIAGIREIAAARGYDVKVDSYAEDPERPQPVTLNYRKVAGVLSIANATPFSMLQEMYKAGIPMSLVSHQVPELPIPAVIVDNTQGMAELVKHVVERCNRRKLIYIRGLTGQRDADEREAAFLREMMRYNLPVSADTFIRGDFSAAIAAQSVRNLIATRVDFDSVIAADYLMGAAAIQVFRQAGISVPGQVSVVGFGDAPEAETYGLTTAAADIVDQGRRATRQLLSQIEGLPISGVTVLSIRLIIRESCGCLTLA